jgi:hypothetical protein
VEVLLGLAELKELLTRVDVKELLALVDVEELLTLVEAVEEIVELELAGLKVCLDETGFAEMAADRVEFPVFKVSLDETELAVVDVVRVEFAVLEPVLSLVKLLVWEADEADPLMEHDPSRFVFPVQAGLTGRIQSSWATNFPCVQIWYAW